MSCVEGVTLPSQSSALGATFCYLQVAPCTFQPLEIMESRASSQPLEVRHSTLGGWEVACAGTGSLTVPAGDGSRPLSPMTPASPAGSMVQGYACHRSFAADRLHHIADLPGQAQAPDSPSRKGGVPPGRHPSTVAKGSRMQILPLRESSTFASAGLGFSTATT